MQLWEYEFKDFGISDFIIEKMQLALFLCHHYIYVVYFIHVDIKHNSREFKQILSIPKNG